MKTTIHKTLMFLIGLLYSISGNAQQAFGEIRGLIKNDQNEVVSFATVKVLQNTQLIGGFQADAEGHYHYKPLDPGYYELVIMDAGHVTKKLSDIKVIAGEATYCNIRLRANTLATVEITAAMDEEKYEMKGVDRSMYVMKTMDATELLQNASTERGIIKTAIVAMTSDAIEGPDGELHVRGGRGGASSYYVDGVRVLELEQLPALSIEQLTVFSGGVPAMYGDVLSGVIVVSTRSYFSGIREKRVNATRARERREEKKRWEQEEAERKAGVEYK